MHFVYKLDILFHSIRISDKNSSVTWALQCFLTLFELRTSFVFSTQHSKQRHQFPTCSDIICCFSVIYRFVQRAKWRWNWKSLQNELWKCWNLAWYHHFTRIACAKEHRGSRQKMDALRVQTGQSLSEYQDFGQELICYTGTSMFFKLIWTLDFFCVQYAAFKVTSSISNMFWHHLLFCSHLPNC